MKQKVLKIDLKKGATMSQLRQFWAQKGPRGIKILHDPILNFKGRQYATYGNFYATQENQYINLIDTKTGKRKVGVLRKWKLVGVKD